MSRHLHLDPYSGIAGDMVLGLLFDLGLDAAVLEGLPARLGLEGVEVRCGRALRGALDAGHVRVIVRGHEEPAAPVVEPGHGHDLHEGHGGETHAPHRHLDDMFAILARADLPARAGAIASRAFHALYAAESAVHGVPLDQIHLHEAGADDAIVDIAGSALGIVELGIESVSCSVPLPLGGGAIHTAHGILPVPGPAVAELLRGLPVTGGPVPRELVTPTGAALLRALVDEFRPLPELTLLRAGHGAGTWNEPPLPSVLRGMLGEIEPGPRERALAVLEAQLDDVLPQDVPVIVDRLLAGGARDAFVTPVQMKKGRPGFLLTVICEPADERALATRLLSESPTLGVRCRREMRLEWDRDTVEVDTPWGPVRVKRALDARGRPLRGQPEFEDCRRVADRAGVPVDEVRRRARENLDAGGRE